MQKIIEYFNAKKQITLLLYSMNNTNSDRVKKVLALHLNQFQCGVLLPPVFTCVKELLVNAIRANYKSIFSESYSKKKKPGHFLNQQTRQKLFRLELERKDMNNFLRIARYKDIYASINFNMDGDVLGIVVSNPAAMSVEELGIIKKKLEDARKCRDINEYFLQYEDGPETDEAGFGLIFISMVLRSLGLEQSSFRLISKDGYTRAYLSISLNSKTIRNFQKNTVAAM